MNKLNWKSIMKENKYALLYYKHLIMKEFSDIKLTLSPDEEIIEVITDE